MDDEKWRDLLKEVDVNGDGKISFKEFSDAIESFITKSYNF
jgi:Ca2+-binding EF-hand superfamily protein